MDLKVEVVTAWWQDRKDRVRDLIERSPESKRAELLEMCRNLEAKYPKSRRSGIEVSEVRGQDFGDG